MTRTIVVPLDGSKLAERALRLADVLCEPGNSRLHLVQVRGTSPAAELADPGAGRAYLAERAESLKRSGFDVHAALLPPEPAELLLPTPSPATIAQVICEYARAHHADAIVLSSHGRGGFSRFWFGSVADAMLRTSTTPMLVVKEPLAEHPNTQDWRAFSHVLIAVAGDQPSHCIMASTALLTGPIGPHYTLLRVLNDQVPMITDSLSVPVMVPAPDIARAQAEAQADLEHLSDALPTANVAVATALNSSAAHGILDYAAAHGVDLVVVGTRALRGLERIMLGSVADKVVRGAECSVLVVPVEAEERAPADDEC